MDWSMDVSGFLPEPALSNAFLTRGSHARGNGT